MKMIQIIKKSKFSKFKLGIFILEDNNNNSFKILFDKCE